jgi:hypothetical protein
MGHQVNFFMLPSDLSIAERAIQSAGDVAFLEDRSKTAEPKELHTITFEPGDTGKRSLRAYIVRDSDRGLVKTRFIEQQGYWVIDSLDSPVIEFDRCYFDGVVLRRGRAYFASDLRFRPRLPSTDFVKWGDRILLRLKKQLIRAPSISSYVYASAGALEWIGQRGVTGNELSYHLSTTTST